MKVVLATHRTNQWLGVNKYFWLLGKYLARMGVQVRFVIDSPRGVDLIKQCCDSSENIEVVGLGPVATNPVSTMMYCDILSNYLSGHDDFDILHCGHVLPFFYLMRKNRKPVVFQPFGNELFTLAGRGINKWYCKMAQPILRYCGEKADILLSEGKFQTEEMMTYYPRALNIVVLPVGVEMEEIKPKDDYSAIGRFQFLAVNSLLPYEAMDELINGIGALRDKAILIIVGKGEEKDNLNGISGGLGARFQQKIWQDLYAFGMLTFGYHF